MRCGSAGRVLARIVGKDGTVLECNGEGGRMAREERTRVGGVVGQVWNGRGSTCRKVRKDWSRCGSSDAGEYLERPVGSGSVRN